MNICIVGMFLWFGAYWIIDMYLHTNIYIYHSLGLLVISGFFGYYSALLSIDSIRKHSTIYEEYYDNVFGKDSCISHIYLDKYARDRQRLFSWKYAMLKNASFVLYYMLAPLILCLHGYSYEYAFNPVYIIIAPPIIISINNIMTYIWLRYIFVKTELKCLGLTYAEFTYNCQKGS